MNMEKHAVPPALCRDIYCLISVFYIRWKVSGYKNTIYVIAYNLYPLVVHYNS